MKKQKSFLNAMKWAYVGNWGEKGFSAVFTIILAGIIGPKEFGTVSLCLIYVGFLSMFLDQGFATALVQRKDLKQEHLDAVFWMDLVLSLVLISISYLFARQWANVNHAPQAAYIIPILSTCILFESMSLVQICVLKREMNFRSLTLRNSSSILLAGFVGLGMAIAGFGVWALVAQQLTKDLSALVILWRLSTWRPRFHFSFKHLKELFGFSALNFIGQLGVFADAQAGSIALGLFFGPTAVGLYRVADRVVSSVISIAMSATQSVSLPEFARHQDNPEELRATAKTCLRLSALTTVPALSGLAMVSQPLLATIGAQWAVAANVLTVLCILGILLIFTFFTAPLMQALAKTREFAILEWARTLVGFAMLVVAGMYVRHSADFMQILGIAVARLAAAVCFITPVFLCILFKLSKITFGDFVDAIKIPVIASVFIVVSVRLFQMADWFPAGPPVVRLIAEVLVGTIFGVPVLFYLDLQLRNLFFSYYHRLTKRKAPSL